MIGGRNRRRTRSGASATVGNPRTRASASRALTRRIGVDSPKRRAATATAAVVITSPAARYRISFITDPLCASPAPAQLDRPRRGLRLREPVSPPQPEENGQKAQAGTPTPLDTAADASLAAARDACRV